MRDWSHRLWPMGSCTFTIISRFNTVLSWHDMLPDNGLLFSIYEWKERRLCAVRRRASMAWSHLHTQSLAITNLLFFDLPFIILNGKCRECQKTLYVSFHKRNLVSPLQPLHVISLLTVGSCWSFSNAPSSSFDAAVDHCGRCACMRPCLSTVNSAATSKFVPFEERAEVTVFLMGLPCQWGNGNGPRVRTERFTWMNQFLKDNEGNETLTSFRSLNICGHPSRDRMSVSRLCRVSSFLLSCSQVKSRVATHTHARRAMFTHDVYSLFIANINDTHTPWDSEILLWR